MAHNLEATDMTTIHNAMKLLRNAESGFRNLVGQAAESGEYEAVFQLTSCAKEVSRLLRGLEQSASTGEANSNGAVLGDAPLQAVRESSKSSKDSSPQTDSSKSTRSKARSPRRDKKRASGYPRFFRRGDELVKVGWSKQGKKEYQHKAPRRILSAVIKAMLEAGGKDRLVSTQDFLPAHDSLGEVEIPAYQAYLCLAWLRTIACIEQHGRNGYSVVNPDEFGSAIDKAWKRLDEK